MINPSVFKFLKDLKKNNNREWFAEHKGQYEEVKSQAIALTAAVIAELSKTDASFSNVQPHKAVLRIYRDVRFSLNKAPYKTNIGISINPRGKGTEGPGYYLHLEPGACFIGGGWWMPPAPNLKNIRQEIDYNEAEFRSIVNAKAFKKYYGELSKEDALLNAPKGYAKDHSAIDYLRLKSFTAFHALADEDLSKPKIAKHIADAIFALKPLDQFLQKAL